MCYTAYPIRVVETNCSGEICFRSAKFQAHGCGAPIYCYYQYGNARHDCCSNRPLNRPSENITLVRFTSVRDLLILDNDTTSPSRVALDMLTHSQPHPAYSAHGDGASSSGPNPLEHPSHGASAWKDSFTSDPAADEAVRKKPKSQDPRRPASRWVLSTLPSLQSDISSSVGLASQSVKRNRPGHAQLVLKIALPVSGRSMTGDL